MTLKEGIRAINDLVNEFPDELYEELLEEMLDYARVMLQAHRDEARGDD